MKQCKLIVLTFFNHCLVNFFNEALIKVDSLNIVMFFTSSPEPSEAGLLVKVNVISYRSMMTLSLMTLPCIKLSARQTQYLTPIIQIFALVQ